MWSVQIILQASEPFVSLTFLFLLSTSQQKVGHRQSEVKYEAAVCRPAPVEADQEACCRGDVKHTSSCLTSVSIKPCRPVFKPQPHFQRPLLPSPFSQVGLSVELLCEPFPTLPSSKTKKDCDDVSDVDSVPRKTNSWAIKSWKTGSYAGTPTRLQTFRDVNSEPGVYGI